MPRVSGVSGRRLTRMSVRARNASSSFPVKTRKPSTRLGLRLQPATSNPMIASLRAASLLAQMHETMQHDVLAHAVREVVLHDAHDRNVRQIRIAHQMVDAGAKGEDDVEVRKPGQSPGLRTPGRDVAHAAAIARLAEQDGLALREEAAETLDPR